MKNSPTRTDSAPPAAGFPCPCCRIRINIPLQALLTEPSIACPQCGLELKIDLDNSAAVLENLGRYFNGMEEAQRILKAGLPD